MNNIAIVQFDSRFDKYCMCEVNGKKVIEYTVERVFKIKDVQKVIISTKNTVENKKKLEKIFVNLENVEVLYSEVDLLGKRFIESLKDKKYNFVFRIRADQSLLNFKAVNNILNDIQKKGRSFYYNPNNPGDICDFINCEEVKKRESEIELLDRYFKVYTDREVNECIKIYNEKENFLNKYINDNFKLELFENGINKGSEEKEFEEAEKSIQQNLLSETGHLYKLGYISSFYRSSLTDLENNSIPWMNYGIIKFLEERLRKDFVVAEYGSGNSTMWLQERVRELYSVEHDITWFELVKDKIGENVIYKHVDLNKGYENTLQSFNKKFDMIFIDGRKRELCTRSSIELLKDNGVIILDDSEREYVKDTLSYIKSLGYKTISFEGIKALSIHMHRTTICYKEKNCLGI